MMIIKKFHVLQGIFKIILLFFLNINLGCSKIEYSTVDNTKFNEITKLIVSKYKKGDTLTFNNNVDNELIKLIISQIKIDEYKAKNGYYLTRTPSNHKILTVYIKILDENIKLSNLRPFIYIRGFPKDFGQEEEYSITLDFFDFNETLINYDDIKNMKNIDTLLNSKTDSNTELKNINSIVWKKDKGLIAFKSNKIYYNLSPKSTKTSK